MSVTSTVVQMTPNVELIHNESDTVSFTLSGINVSLANALRRTLLSDIPTVVFRTTPHEENRCTIHSNTSRLNHEKRFILKEYL